jgi:site-specific DNA-methyltransferase (adenine-specific)
MTLPSKKYNIIYADPPWRFETYSEGGKERHYNCMNIEDIYNLPVKDITN